MMSDKTSKRVYIGDPMKVASDVMDAIERHPQFNQYMEASMRYDAIQHALWLAHQINRSFQQYHSIDFTAHRIVRIIIIDSMIEKN